MIKSAIARLRAALAVVEAIDPVPATKVAVPVLKADALAALSPEALARLPYHKRPDRPNDLSAGQVAWLNYNVPEFRRARKSALLAEKRRQALAARVRQ